jgi:hypothetical protein
MRIAIVIVIGIVATFFAASGLTEGYDCVRLLPMVSSTMWWFVARQLATSAVFVGLGWVVWRQPLPGDRRRVAGDPTDEHTAA